MKKTDLKKALINMVDPIVSPLGFKKQKGSDGFIFRRITEVGFNDISLLIWPYGDLSYVSLGFLIRISQLNNIFIPYSEYVIHEKDETITIGVDIQTLGYKDDNKIKVENEDDLAYALEILQKTLIEKHSHFLINSFRYPQLIKN